MISFSNESSNPHSQAEAAPAADTLSKQVIPGTSIRCVFSDWTGTEVEFLDTPYFFILKTQKYSPHGTNNLLTYWQHLHKYIIL